MSKVTTRKMEKTTVVRDEEKAAYARVGTGNDIGISHTPHLLAGLIFVDNNLLVKSCTDKVHDLFNISVAEIYGPFDLFAYLINSPELLLSVKQAISNRKGSELTISPSPDHHVLIQIQSVNNNDINDGGVVLICYNLDKSSQAMTESLDPVLMAIHSATIGVFDWQIDNDIMMLNESVCLSFGISSKQIPITYVDWLNMIYLDDQPAVKQAMEMALKETDILDIWFRVRHPENGLRYFYARGAVYFDKNSHVRRITSTCVDMTEHKQVETKFKLSEAKLGLAVDTAGIGIWDWNVEQNKMVWNEKMQAILGLESNDASGSYDALMKCVHAKDKPEVEVNLKKAIDTSSHYQGQFRIVNPDKGIRYINMLAKPYYDDYNKQKNIVGTCMDVTEQKYAKDQLKTTVESSPVAMILMNERGKIVFVNKHAELLFGYISDELIDHSIEQLFPKGLRKHHIKEHEVYSKDKEPILISKVRELWIQHKNGTRIPVEMSSSTLMTHQGRLVMNVVKDITERKDAERVLLRTNQVLEKEVVDLKQTEEALENLAHYDSLTQLPNRSYFQETLARSLAQAKRGEYQLAVIYIDLDNFKKANDSLGHSAGDNVLKLAAKRLLEVTRDSDFVARLGGDEFVILSSVVDDTYSIAKLSKRLIEAFSQSFVVNKYEFKCTASIGIAMYPTAGQTADEIMQHADAAMYYAKDAGKSNYQFYSEKINQQNQRRLNIENELLHALERDEMYLVYHPQFSLADGSLSGIEVLLRWENQSLGLVSPFEFIPIAEETRLIEPIGVWVFKKASEQFKQWINESPKLFKNVAISINCAIQQLSTGNFPLVVEKVLNDLALPPERVLFEVTETGLMENVDYVLNALHMLQRLGVGIAVDDFGKGYSSLSYLKELPITELKIDASFVQDIEDDANDQAIIKAIIQLSQALQLRTVAEGVETKAQQDFLNENGCETVQGFLYTKPIKADELIVYLNETKAILL